MKCPNCGYETDKTMDMVTGEDYHAQTGDVGMCLRCGVFQTIDGAGQLILLTPEMKALLNFTERETLDNFHRAWSRRFGQGS